MNNDDNVPNTTPRIIVRANPKIVLPPSNTNGNKTTKVVNDVIVVLLSVVFNEFWIISLKSNFFIILLFSLILSKMIIVSFKEYPTIVIKAAIVFKSICMGTPIACNMAIIEIVINIS